MSYEEIQAELQRLEVRTGEAVSDESAYRVSPRGAKEVEGVQAESMGGQIRVTESLIWGTPTPIPLLSFREWNLNLRCAPFNFRVQN